MMGSEELKATTKSLAKLFSSFPQSALVDVDLQLRSYLEAVKDFTFADVEAAIDRFRRGEAKVESKAFCPSSAQLCDEIRERKLMRELLAKRGNLTIVKA